MTYANLILLIDLMILSLICSGSQCQLTKLIINHICRQPHCEYCYCVVPWALKLHRTRSSKECRKEVKSDGVELRTRYVRNCCKKSGKLIKSGTVTRLNAGQLSHDHEHRQHRDSRHALDTCLVCHNQQCIYVLHHLQVQMQVDHVLADRISMSVGRIIRHSSNSNLLSLFRILRVEK